MTQPLFFEPEPYNYIEKVGGEVDLPDDPNQWPQQILQEVYKQVPYIADYQPHVVMKRVDAERGYGLGHVEIMNQTEAPQGSPDQEMKAAGIRTVRIPFIIRESKLSPFDLLMNDQSKMIPLTENRLRTALFRPQAFDVTSRTPGDQSMIGQLYPPYRQNYGFGGGGMSMNASGGMAMGKLGSALEQYLAGADTSTESLELRNRASVRVKTSSALNTPTIKKTGSILDAVLGSIDPRDHESFLDELSKSAGYLTTTTREQHDSVITSLQKVVDATPLSFKLASWLDIVEPSVTQVTKRNDGYLMKVASHEAWDPQTFLVDRGMVVRSFGERVAMDVDQHGSATVQEMEGEPEAGATEESAPVPTATFGLYKVRDTVGKEHVGFVIPSLIDLNGDDVPIKLFTNGTVVAVQADMVGEPAGTGGNLPNGPVSGEGFFWGPKDDGGVCATIPFKFESSATVGDQPKVLNGQTFDGSPASVSVQPNIIKPVGQGGTLLIPSTWQWMPLDGASSVTVLGDEEQHKAEVGAEKKSHVIIRSDGSTFSFEGDPVEKLSYDQTKFLDVGGAMFLLAGLGVHQVVGTEKLAQAVQGGMSSEVLVGREITLDRDMRKQATAWRDEVREMTDKIRQPHLIKEAASIPDPTAVDTVLSLGFVNPDNLMNYVSYLPDLDGAQSKLCELLFGVRLGISNVPQSALERSVRSLEEVIEGLKIIAFQGN